MPDLKPREKQSCTHNFAQNSPLWFKVTILGLKNEFTVLTDSLCYRYQNALLNTCMNILGQNFKEKSEMAHLNTLICFRAYDSDILKEFIKNAVL